MGGLRSGAGSGVAVLFALVLGAPVPQAAAQASADPPARVSKSVRGKLESIDKSLNGVVIKTDSGERLAWKFDPAVIAEALHFKPGDPVIVIYRRETAPAPARRRAECRSRAPAPSSQHQPAG